MAASQRAAKAFTCRASQATRCLRSPVTSHFATSRPYHSYDHPASAGPFNPSEKALLSAAYAHVPEHGFSQKALSLGAKDAGYPDISTSVLPDGAFDLIRYHLATRREELAGTSKRIYNQGEEEAKAKVGQKIERLTWERLLANQDVVHHWQEALAIMAQPSYVPASLKELALLSDEIWFLSGDTSVDPSWYTKRGSLATIYASSELFMTNDRSAGYADTRDFLNKRLGEVKDAGSALGSVGQWVGFTASAGVNVLRSKGLPI